MTLAHFVYIPGVFLLGIVIGFVLGGRAAENARADREHADRRRRARSARTASGGDDEAAPPP